MTDISISRLWLNFNDEDYTDSVCLLLPKGQATLIDVAQFAFAAKFDWQVMGRSIFYVESLPVRHIRRYCGIGRTGFGNFRYKAKSKMHSLHRVLFLDGIAEISECQKAGRSMSNKHIDHANRNPWDNRWSNLRIATPSQNAHNCAPAKNKSSQYKGVCKVKGRERWVANIRVKGKLYHLGTFDDEFKAAQAYNAAVRKYCPEFGYINPLSC